MSTSITTSFVTDYMSDMHVAFQQGATKLRGLTRLKTGVIGSTATFQVIGKGYAGTKSRHGDIPLMNATHTTASATLTDYYAGEYIDKLDELKIKHDERRAAAINGAGALGRKIDNLIITVLDSGAGTTDTTSTAGLTKARIFTALETLNGNDVPDDGRRVGLVGPHQWNELINISEVKSADYVGDLYPFLRGTQSFKWQNVLWVLHTGLPLDSGTRKVFLYHPDAVGYAEGQMPQVDIQWIGEKQAWLFAHSMSGGAVAIDGTGIYEIQCDDDEAIS